MPSLSSVNRVGKTLYVNGKLQEIVRILTQNGQLAGTPVGIHADHIVIGNDTVTVIFILDAVTVEVAVDILGNLSLVIQCPLAVIDNIIQIRNLILIKEILVEQTGPEAEPDFS